ATPSPVPGKRMTAPAIRARKDGGKTAQPIVMLTAYTMRMAQLLDPHCDMLLVGDSLGQVIYGLPSTIPVTMELMCAHGAAVGAFCIVVEGVMEGIATKVARNVAPPIIGIGASAECDGQVLVTEDMLGLFERTPRFVKRYDDLAARIGDAAAAYASEVRDRSFPTAEQTYRPKP